MFNPRRARMGQPSIRRAELALQRAHQLLNAGQPEEAAGIFHTLADGLGQRGMGVRAVMVRMQAAYAEALSNMPQPAIHSASLALDNPAAANRPMRIATAAERVVEVLRQKGHEPEANDLELKLDGLLQKAGTSRQKIRAQLAAAGAQHHGELPAKCPSCGGSLLPDEVEWHDASTASCTYCGSAVKAS